MDRPPRKSGCLIPTKCSIWEGNKLPSAKKGGAKRPKQGKIRNRKTEKGLCPREGAAKPTGKLYSQHMAAKNMSARKSKGKRGKFVNHLLFVQRKELGQEGESEGGKRGNSGRCRFSGGGSAAVTDFAVNVKRSAEPTKWSEKNMHWGKLSKTPTPWEGKKPKHYLRGRGAVRGHEGNCRARTFCGEK